MSGHPFFALISRMSNIARWSLMRNSRVENVQEHSHMVADRKSTRLNSSH